jgi:hypothetical protein
MLLSKLSTASRLSRGATAAFSGAAAPFNTTRRLVLDLLPGSTSAASRRFILHAADEFATAGREAGEAASRGVVRDFAAVRPHPLSAIAGEELSLQIKQGQHLKDLGVTASNLERILMGGGMAVTGTAAGAGVVGMTNDAVQTISSSIDYLKDLGSGQADVSVVPAGR